VNTSIAVAPINAPNSSIVSLGPIQAVRKPPAQLHRGARHCAVQLAFRGAGQRNVYARSDLWLARSDLPF